MDIIHEHLQHGEYSPTSALLALKLKWCCWNYGTKRWRARERWDQDAWWSRDLLVFTGIISVVLMSLQCKTLTGNTVHGLAQQYMVKKDKQFELLWGRQGRPYKSRGNFMNAVIYKTFLINETCPKATVYYVITWMTKTNNRTHSRITWHCNHFNYIFFIWLKWYE